MKTSELTGALLDYWVAKAEGEEAQLQTYGDKQICVIFCREFSPSDNWAQGGPIIERERIELHLSSDGWYAQAQGQNGWRGSEGDTALIAAMRAYVASKLGDTVPDDPQ